METYKDAKRNISISARVIEIGEQVEFGSNIEVSVKGTFRLGDYSRLGNDCQIIGNNVKFGNNLFNSSGLRVGGGGRFHPNANLTIGDRCTIHNNFINVCEPVFVGDDVGLSPDVSILTHGYWMSVLDGYPATFSGVSIGNSVIIGYRSLVMMGVSIADEVVIGAQSVVSRSIEMKGVYAGAPAKRIRDILPLSESQRRAKLNDIVAQYYPIARYRGIEPNIQVDYPWVSCAGFRFNAETLEHHGLEDEITDDFRDYIRKWGIRLYTGRPFRSRA